MADTDQDLTVSWKGTAVANVVSGSGADNFESVDCSTIDSVARDNRDGLANPTASLQISLKDEHSHPFVKGDFGTLIIGDDFSETMRVSEISKPIGVGAHIVIDVSFVSTEESA